MILNQNELKSFTLENADIFLKNFSGRATKYTPEGTRNFMLRLPDEVANRLAEDGWNVSYLKPREEGDPPTPALRIAVNFKGYRPPEIYKIVGRTKTMLSEDTVSLLDTAEIVTVDLRVRPRVWGDENKGGVKAYLEKMYVTVVEDDLDAKYNFGDPDDELPFEQ